MHGWGHIRSQWCLQIFGSGKYVSVFANFDVFINLWINKEIPYSCTQEIYVLIADVQRYQEDPSHCADVTVICDPSSYRFMIVVFVLHGMWIDNCVRQICESDSLRNWLILKFALSFHNSLRNSMSFWKCPTLYNELGMIIPSGCSKCRCLDENAFAFGRWFWEPCAVFLKTSNGSPNVRNIYGRGSCGLSKLSVHFT